jgi:hypothetical protein
MQRGLARKREFNTDSAHETGNKKKVFYRIPFIEMHMELFDKHWPIYQSNEEVVL